MPTTKVRTKTPMKNKPALWRSLAKKRYEGGHEIRDGRQIRNIMMQMEIGKKHAASNIIVNMMKKGGFYMTPVDKVMPIEHNGDGSISASDSITLNNA